MTNKNLKTKEKIQQNNTTIEDRRDVELSFLKKVNEEYSLLSSTNKNDQNDHGEKRGRTTSDYENDTQSDTASSINKNILFSSTNQSIDSTNNQQHDTFNNNNNECNNKFIINKSAITFAISRTLPPIKLICDPKIDNQKNGNNIIKELFKSIDKEFKRIHPKHNDAIGFESWYIDYNGDINGITSDIDLFTFFCDNQHIPNVLLNIKINPVLPKNLPPQRSVLIKGVPNYLTIEDIKIEIINKYKSIYYIDEIIGTNNGKTRYVRIDFLNFSEYNQILNSGIISFDGQCFHVHEYLAAPKVLFCSRCNIPGHTKKQCDFTFERCKRCGKNRKEGEHKECLINCHNCGGSHVSTDFRCSLVHGFREQLIQHLQQHPEYLPDSAQIFIPSHLRQHKQKFLSKNLQNDKYHEVKQFKMKNNNNINEWPLMPPAVHDTLSYSKYSNGYLDDTINLHVHLNKFEQECYEAKQNYDKKHNDIKTKINSCLNQIQSIMNCFSSTIQRQNEMMYVLKSSLNECLEIIRISNQAICLMMTKSGDQQFTKIIEQLSTIPFDERQATINKNFLLILH
ncbi:unnamed protein product [Rotaria sordida]|uniref:CCHC-type domain-containing protein n=1 Tax=Rotaria sordida TaxID=392033 RepID=A0A813YNX7_9BILA|nr:unnamed protein product [Rotaria sordida]CAF4109035.1 unnamed protein product [Rotaria sordida]